MSADKSEATPRPWEAGKLYRTLEGEGFNFSGGDVDIYPPLGEAGPVAIANSEANAALIVECVNRASSVDALVEAAREMIDESEPRWHEDGKIASFVTPYNMGGLLWNLRKALAPFTEEEK